MDNQLVYADDLQLVDRFFEENRSRWSTVFILVDSNTHEFCLATFLNAVSLGSDVEILEIEAGEESKDLEIAQGLWLTLSELNADRKTLLINLGGGVVCDLGGWVAANYKRGIDFIHVPTSLLAMVDASIGGKTGIDMAGIKNLIGSFSNPQKVFLHPDFLDTLNEGEWLSGYAEMLKHALISSSDHWSSLKGITLDRKDLIKSMIEKSGMIKAKIVDDDFKEEGKRKLLNFGHTFGHAIESTSLERGESLSHGHAVAVGMMLESIVSYKKSGLKQNALEDILQTLIKLYPIPSWLTKDTSAIISKMQKDKKNDLDKIKMVLLSEIGKASFDHEISEEEIINSLSFIQAYPSNG